MASSSATKSPTAASAAHAVAAASSHTSREQILSALEGDIVVREVPGSYLTSVAFVIIALILLPLAYIGMIVGVGWLIARHAMHLFESMNGRSFPVFSLIPDVIGCVVLAFLIKPLFFGKESEKDTPITLRREEEPLLYDFVTRMCEIVGAPVPKRIEVDFSANASASFARGIRSVFSRDMVLRIGLSLVAGLSLRDFAGVLAHEFAHFTQRGGMGSSYLVRRLSIWFARVVAQRDALDHKLESWKRSRYRSNRVAARLIWWLVESGRGIAWTLLMTSEWLSGGVMRRMEYEADRYEAAVAGTSSFERSMKILTLLEVAAQGARHSLRDSWESHRLADDLPKLIAANARLLSKKTRQDVLKWMTEDKTGWLDTHPCFKDRVKNIADLDAHGLFRLDLPAKAVFADFRALCRRATELQYKKTLKEEYSPANLVPTQRLVDEQAATHRAFESLGRFFRGRILAARPILPDRNTTERVPNPKETIVTLRDARESMVEAAETVRGAIGRYKKAQGEVTIARARLSFISLAPPWSVRRQEQKVKRELEAAVARQNGALQTLTLWEETGAMRLTTALRLLLGTRSVERFPAPVDPAAIRQRAATLIRVCHLIRESVAPVDKLRSLATSLHVMVMAYNPDRPYPPLVERINLLSADVTRVVRDIVSRHADLPYPFDHAQADISVGHALIERIPDGKSPFEALGTAATLIDRYYMLVYRSLAGLTELAEKVETAAGLAPLPELPEETNKDDEEEEDEDDEGQSKRKPTWRQRLAYPTRAAAGFLLLAGLVWLSLSSESAPPAVAAVEAPARPAVAPRQQPRPASPQFQPTEPTRPVPSAPSAPFAAAPRNPVSPSDQVRALPQPRRSTPDIPFVQSQNKLHAIYTAIEQWRVDHNGAYPGSLDDLVNNGSLDEQALRSPGSEKRFVYVTDRRPDAPPESILLYDSAIYPANGGRGPALTLNNRILLIYDENAFQQRLRSAR